MTQHTTNGRIKMDLHVHTTYSDGALAPRKAAEAARAAGLDAVALTDHDECRAFLEAADVRGIAVIPGVELSAQYGGEVHVLGLGIDCSSAAMLAHAEKAANTRRVRAAAMLERLSDAGMMIDMADVEAQCFGGAIGRPHLAAVLVGKGYAKTLQEAFDRYLSKDTPFYVPQQRISVARAVELIGEAGGLSVLAHPGLLGERVWDSLRPQIKALGFWGIEAYHPAHTDGQCVAYESAARQYGLFVTSGSDYHGSETKVGIGGETRGTDYLQQSFAAFARQMETRGFFEAHRY